MRYLVARAFMVTTVMACATYSAAWAQDLDDIVATLPYQGMVDIAVEEWAQYDLGLDKNAPEVAEIRKLADAQKGEIRDRMKSGNPRERSDRVRFTKIRVDVQTKYQAELKKVLKPEQFTRVQQLRWRQISQQALLDPDLGEALALSDEQREKLAAAQIQFARAERQTDRADSPENKGTALKTARDARQDWAAKIREILTADQQTKYHELLGPAIKTLQRVTFSRPGGILQELLEKEPIRKELGLQQDGPELTALQKFVELLKAELTEQVKNDTPEQQKAGEAAIEAARSRYNDEVAKVLKPEQFKRLGQIRLQSHGSLALRGAKTIAALNITPEQQAKIAVVEQECHDRYNAVLKAGGVFRQVSDPAVQKEWNNYRAETLRLVTEVLTPEQREKFAEMRGRPFDTTQQ